MLWHRVERHPDRRGIDAGFMPSHLLGPRGLPASPNAREVELGGSATTEDQLVVQIRQVGTTAIWDRWRLVDLGTVVKDGADVGLGAFRFDAKAYAADLVRAAVDADRRWPARVVAESLKLMVRDDEDGGRWIRRCFGVRAPQERPDVVEVRFYARDMSGLRYATPGHYVVTFPVDDSDPDPQAQVIAHRLSHEDLKLVSVYLPPRGR
jgi:hypothetical protein